MESEKEYVFNQNKNLKQMRRVKSRINTILNQTKNIKELFGQYVNKLKNKWIKFNHFSYLIYSFS